MGTIPHVEKNFDPAHDVEISNASNLPKHHHHLGGDILYEKTHSLNGIHHLEEKGSAYADAGPAPVGPKNTNKSIIGSKTGVGTSVVAAAVASTRSHHSLHKKYE